MAFCFQVKPQSLGQVRFIFDNQDTTHATLRGSSMVMVVPRPSPSLSA